MLVKLAAIFFSMILVNNYVLIPLGLPVDIPCSAEDYAAAIGLDKKGAGADLTLILLEKLGRAVPHKLPKAELLRLL